MSKRSNAEIVMDAIQDLHSMEQVVTRETLREITDLPLSVIDDRLAYLIDTTQITRVQRGVFVPAPVHRPARPMLKMILPDGTVKIEVGDDHVLTLTPRENRALGELMAGAGQQFASIELGHKAAHLASDLENQLNQVRRELSAMKKKMAAKGLGGVEVASA